MSEESVVAMLRQATHEPYQLGLYIEGTGLVPPVPDHCITLEVGPIRFVVEARQLTDEAVADSVVGAEVSLDWETPTFDDFGASLHVCGTADALEHLRFDCFEHKPHYHYIHNERNGNTICRIDQYAEGDPIDWTLDRLRTRLPEMLEFAGATELARQTRVQQTRILGVMDEVADLLAKARIRAFVEQVEAQWD